MAFVVMYKPCVKNDLGRYVLCGPIRYGYEGLSEAEHNACRYAEIHGVTTYVIKETDQSEVVKEIVAEFGACLKYSNML